MVPNDISQSIDPGSFLTRTVNEYATSYSIEFPEDWDGPRPTGQLRYSISQADDEVRLIIEPNSDAEDYGPNDLLSTDPNSLPFPTGVIEALHPESIGDMTWTNERIEIPISLTNVPEGHIAKGNQRIRERGGEPLLTLPAVDALAEKGACTYRLARDADGLAFIVTAVSDRTDASPVVDAEALPQTPVPPALAAALGQAAGSVSVYVFDGGPSNAREDILDTFPSSLGMTASKDIRREDGEVGLGNSPALDDALDRLGFEEGSGIEVAADNGTPLLILDPREAGKVTASRRDGSIFLPEAVAPLGIPRCNVHWHEHDGRLIGELLCERPVPPSDPNGFAGEVDDTKDDVELTLPTDVFPENVPNTLGATVTYRNGQPVLAFGPEGDASFDAAVDSNGITVELPRQFADTIGFTKPGGVLTVNDRGLVFAMALAPDEVKRRDRGEPEESPADATNRSRLYIPEDGKNAFLRQAGEGNHAVGLPREAIEQFDLEEGSKFSIRVGSSDDYLALECTPIADEDVDSDVCLGRMLSQTNLRLPIQLVASLSLFDRSLTWGLDWGQDGARLVALVESMETPVLSEGIDIGEGRVSISEQTADSTRHYDVTIPVNAFDMYAEHPPGVFVGYEQIDGDARLMLLPVSEADIDMPGAVKLRGQEDDEQAYRVTIPKGLATALPLKNEERVSWTFADGQFVGTMATSETL